MGGVPEKLSGRVDRKVLKWFGHVERMGSDRMTKRVYVSEVEGERGTGRPPFRGRDGVRRACAEREIGLEAAREVCLDRDAWRSLTDRIVRLIKCGQGHTFDAVRRGIGTSGGTPLEVIILQWSLVGVLGVTRPHDDRKADNLSGRTSPGVPKSA